MDATGISRLASLASRAEHRNLRIHVVYTTPDATRASLQVARLLARDLDARLELLLPHVIPYPRPLDSPSAAVTCIESFAMALVQDCEADVTVTVLLCRDREVTVPLWLPSESVAVIGRARRWGPGSSRALIRAVRHSGHHVVAVDAWRAGQVKDGVPCKRRVNL